MTALEGVECDGCGRRYTRKTVTQPSAGKVRPYVKARGWHTTHGTYQSTTGQRGYTRDICDQCWERNER